MCCNTCCLVESVNIIITLVAEDGGTSRQAFFEWRRQGVVSMIWNLCSREWMGGRGKSKQVTDSAGRRSSCCMARTHQWTAGTLHSNEKKPWKRQWCRWTSFLLDNFHRRKLRPGATVSLYARDLRKFLSHALPKAGQGAKELLLLHQFLAGISEQRKQKKLPETIARQLRASGSY